MPQFVRRSNSRGRRVALLLLLAAAVGLCLAAVAASGVSKPRGVAQRPGYFLRSLRTSVETLIGSQAAALDGERDELDRDLQQQGGNTSLEHSHAQTMQQAAAAAPPRQPSAAEESSGAPTVGAATGEAPAGGVPSAAQQQPSGEDSGGSGGSSSSSSPVALGNGGTPTASPELVAEAQVVATGDPSAGLGWQQQQLGSRAPTQLHQRAGGISSPAAHGAGAAAEDGAALLAKQRQQASPAEGGASTALADSRQPSAEDSCVVSLKLRKVALMFLTVGELPHEQLWLEWLQQAEGLLPLRALLDPAAVCLRKCGQGSCQLECGHQALCHPACQQQLRERYTTAASDSTPGGGGGGTSPVLRRQHLFSIYTHAPPSFGGYSRSSLFAGTLIERRVVTMWGTHTLMTAERRLLEAAARSPDNAWFVLVSDTTIPLYPPQLLWAQLMAETRSKINACQKPNSHEHRMSKYMETPTFKAEHWRKSSQWFMLTRRHTNMVLADRAIHLAFLRHCRTGYDRFVRQYRQCVSDEHLIPSLLASLGEEGATSCDTWGGTFVEWSGGGSHPRTYWSGEITAGLIEAMRNTHFGGGCENHDAAMEAAGRGFVSLGDLTGERAVCSAALEGAESRAAEYSGTRLQELCTLMGRKVAGEAASAVLKLFRDCSAGLKVLPCPASNSTQQQQEGQQQQQQQGQQQQQQQRQEQQQRQQGKRPLPPGAEPGPPAGSGAQ